VGSQSDNSSGSITAAGPIRQLYNNEGGETAGFYWLGDAAVTPLLQYPLV